MAYCTVSWCRYLNIKNENTEVHEMCGKGADTVVVTISSKTACKLRQDIGAGHSIHVSVEMLRDDSGDGRKVHR